MTGHTDGADKLGWAARLTQRQEMLVVFLLTSGLYLASQLLHGIPAAMGAIAITGPRALASVMMELVIAAVLGPLLVARGWPLRQIVAGARVADIGVACVLLLYVFVAVMVMALAILIVEVHAHGITHLDSLRSSVPHIDNQVPVAIALVLAVVNPVFEELLWLGYWFRSLEGKGVWVAAAVSIGLRTLIHLWKGPVGAVTIIPIAIIFTAYYARTRRLWPIIIAHAVMDAAGLLAHF